MPITTTLINHGIYDNAYKEGSDEEKESRLLALLYLPKKVNKDNIKKIRLPKI